MPIYRLKNRHRQIPNNLKFVQTESGWSAPRFGSFEAICSALLHHRRSNPYLAKKHNWSLDPKVIAEEVDVYNANLCARMGWGDFIYEAGAEPPKKSAPLSQTTLQSVQNAVAGVKKIWNGVNMIEDWILAGAPAVSPEQSEQRAKHCLSCPSHGKGSWTDWFTRPASDAIAKQIDFVKGRKLSTPYDDQLQVCKVCWCPMKVKAQIPIKHLSSMSAEVLNELEQVKPQCWIISELKA